MRGLNFRWDFSMFSVVDGQIFIVIKLKFLSSFVSVYTTLCQRRILSCIFLLLTLP